MLDTRDSSAPPPPLATTRETNGDPPYQQELLLPTMSPSVEVEEQVSRRPSLLRLPPDIRHRIYLHTGVARFDGHACTYYLDGRKESRTERSKFDPPPTRNFAGLLLSCRTLYTETATLLYSANRFVIFYSNHGSLKPLRALSSTALASLTSLKIVLNESSCHQPTDSHNYPPSCCYCRERKWADASYCASKYHPTVHRRPLLDPTMHLDLASAKLATQPMLGEWGETATYLSSYISVGYLELSLVCDIDPNHQQHSLDVGQLAVAPIALFPRLKGCHIRLGKIWNRPLQRLAKEAVLQACRASPRPAKTVSPALTTLPLELRVRILEYTDLITPWREVTISRQHQGYQICRPPCTHPEGGCPPDIHHGCRRIYCNSYVDMPGASERLPGCFCRRRYTAFTSTCHCWAPPTDLFLVCRVLCRDAQFVFFSGNRFIVHDFRALMPWDLPDAQYEPLNPASTTRHYPYERFFASEFLRDIIPVHCLSDLRFLELVFPPYVPHGWPNRELATVLDWHDTVDWIRDKINAPALTITLVMVDFHDGDVPNLRGDLTKDQGHQIIKGYSSILDCFRPPAKDGSLAGIYIQPAFPLRWTPGTRRNMQRHYNWLAEAKQDIKKHAEQFVFGGKDSGTKTEPGKSTWQRWYEVEFTCSSIHGRD